MDQTPLPTLLMRTVIQALGSYPRLSGFVMNILQRLILKKVGIFVYYRIDYINIDFHLGVES